MKNKISNEINFKQLIIGITSLIPGVLVYIVDRPPDRTYFIEKCSLPISLYEKVPNIFGKAGYLIPEFVHVFAFILITASLFSADKKKYYQICLFWFFIDVLFEIGQKFGDRIASVVPPFFAKIPYFENTASYFKLGTFDYFDIMAIIAGTIFAYIVLIMTSIPDIKK